MIRVLTLACLQIFTSLAASPAFAGSHDLPEAAPAPADLAPALPDDAPARPEVEHSHRDAELARALETLSVRFMLNKPRHQVAAARYRAGVFLALLGATGLVALRYHHPQLARVVPDKILNRLGPIKNFADRLGRREAFALVAWVLYAKWMARRHEAINVVEADRLRASLPAGDQRYAANLAQFFALTRAEQFLVARRDPDFADALIAYAELLRTRDFRFESPDYPYWGEHLYPYWADNLRLPRQKTE